MELTFKTLFYYDSHLTSLKFDSGVPVPQQHIINKQIYLQQTWNNRWALVGEHISNVLNDNVSPLDTKALAHIRELVCDQRCSTSGFRLDSEMFNSSTTIGWNYAI